MADRKEAKNEKIVQKYEGTITDMQEKYLLRDEDNDDSGPVNAIENKF